MVTEGSPGPKLQQNDRTGEFGRGEKQTNQKWYLHCSVIWEVVSVGWHSKQRAENLELRSAVRRRKQGAKEGPKPWDEQTHTEREREGGGEGRGRDERREGGRGQRERHCRHASRAAGILYIRVSIRSRERTAVIQLKGEHPSARSLWYN